MISKDEYITLTNQGYSGLEIAKMKNISYQLMRRRMIEEGVWVTKKAKTEEHKKEYIYFRKQHRFLKDVAEKMNITPETLYDNRNRWGFLGDRSEDYQ